MKTRSRTKDLFHPNQTLKEKTIVETNSTKTMDGLTEVESTNLQAAGYAPETKTLTIQFRSGGAVFDYADVPQDLFDSLMAAESKGKFFIKEIKNPVVPGTLEKKYKATKRELKP